MSNEVDDLGLNSLKSTYSWNVIASMQSGPDVLIHGVITFTVNNSLHSVQYNIMNLKAKCKETKLTRSTSNSPAGQKDRSGTG